MKDKFLNVLARRGINPTAIPTKTAKAVYSALAEFVRIARWFTAVLDRRVESTHRNRKMPESKTTTPQAYHDH
jgi:hypothetical protein